MPRRSSNPKPIRNKVTKVAEATATKLKMISWRDDPEIAILTEAISDVSEENKQTVYGRLMRVGIAMCESIRAIAWMLNEQAKETPRTKQSALMGILYPKGDEEALAWVNEAIREKLEREGFEFQAGDEGIFDAIARRYPAKVSADEELIG